jgi:hypothetical protein
VRFVLPIVPPKDLRELIHSTLGDLLSENPMATSSESYVQHNIEFAVLHYSIVPRYYLRIGINYHGQQVQHIKIDADTGKLIGWNPKGDALGTGAAAKVLLAGSTIFDRDATEQLMSDTKIGGGRIEPGLYVRVEFKVRGWLGKTKNLDGAQLEKDINLIQDDKADLLVICLSETAHQKWRGEGPPHQVSRRTGIQRFRQILADPATINADEILERNVSFEGQPWGISTQRVSGSHTSAMPGAEHFVTLAWRRDTRITSDIKPG